MSFFQNPPVPFRTAIPNGSLQPNDTITVRGVAEHSGKQRFEIDLFFGFRCEGPQYDDIALHFNPRFDSNTIVLNSLSSNKWGNEQVHQLGNHFRRGSPFEVRIVAQPNGYQVYVNGTYLCDYPHRMPLNAARVLYIEGGVRLDQVTIQAFGSYPQPQAPQYQPQPPPFYPAQTGFGGPAAGSGGPMFQQAGFGGPAAGSGGPIFQPPVPFTYPTNMYPGKQIHITGTPNHNCDRFHINVLAGADVAFHFNPRVAERVVVRNTKRHGNWESEERDAPHFPFHPNNQFVIILMCDHEGYKVAVNGQHFLLYRHRMPYQQVNALEIDGDLRIQQVQFY